MSGGFTGMYAPQRPINGPAQRPDPTWPHLKGPTVKLGRDLGGWLA